MNRLVVKFVPLVCVLATSLGLVHSSMGQVNQQDLRAFVERSLETSRYKTRGPELRENMDDIFVILPCPEDFTMDNDCPYAPAVREQFRISLLRKRLPKIFTEKYLQRAELILSAELDSFGRNRLTKEQFSDHLYEADFKGLYAEAAQKYAQSKGKAGGVGVDGAATRVQIEAPDALLVKFVCVGEVEMYEFLRDVRNRKVLDEPRETDAALGEPADWDTGDYRFRITWKDSPRTEHQITVGTRGGIYTFSPTAAPKWRKLD